MNNNRGGLHLNRKHAILGGVCAGFADYFNVDRLIIRVITIIAAITWTPTIIAYIILYFVLSDSRPSMSEMGRNIGNSKMGRHFKNVNYRKRIYKNRSDKKISGVCSGIADYLEISPFIVRIVALGSLFFGPFAVIAYIVAAIIMDNNPDEEGLNRKREGRRQKRRRHRREDQYEQQETSRREQYSRPFDTRDIDECSSKFGSLERKLEKLEATITSKKFKLHSEFKKMAAE